MGTIDYRDFDQEIWDKELNDFVPSLIYDMHTHLWSEAHKGTADDVNKRLRWEIDYQDQLAWASKLYPGRKIHYLILGTPVVGMDAQGHNDWIADQMRADPLSQVNMMVTPEMTQDYVAAQVKKHDFFGLKPYRTFAPNPADARIRDFLPEPLIELAHELGLAITMHLSKRIGPADPENLKDLQRYTKRYPKAQWILAHCARGFNAFMLEESIHILKGIPNIWYDTSAVNDIYSHYLLMKHENLTRIMFGTDNVVAGCARGKYITYGRAWEYFGGFPELRHCDATPTFVVYEQLRQHRQVADMLGLTEAEIEDFFSGNAIQFIQQVRASRN